MNAQGLGWAAAEGGVRTEEASPLVMAGILSVLLFPPIALALAGKPPAHAAAFDDRDGL